MPRHHRPRLDVILRVPRHEPYTEKAAADRRKLTNPAPSSQLPTSLSLSSATAASNPDSDQTQQIPLASPSSTSCAEWNSLLIWARRMRGPQWDSGVGMWMVDQGSDEYYAFCNDPTQSVHQDPNATAATATTTTTVPPTSTSTDTPLASLPASNASANEMYGGMPATSHMDTTGNASASVSASSAAHLNGSSTSGGRTYPHHPLANEVASADQRSPVAYHQQPPHLHHQPYS